jgi:hypothetical protein
LGRSAALVHGVALVFLAGGLLVWWLFQNWSDECLTSLGVGSVAYFCMALWSVVLAVRALRNAERAAWPVLVVFAALTEFAAFWVLCSVLYVGDGFGGSRYGLLPLLDKGLEWYVPVWAPFLWLTVLTVAPLARWRVRRAEQKDLRKGRPPWSRRRRWLLGLAGYAAYSALLALIVLPVPVVLYTGLVAGRSAVLLSPRVIVRAMPLWAQRAGRFISARLPRTLNFVEYRLCGEGLLADELVLEEILDPASRAGDEALQAYLQDNPREGWALVDRMILGEVTVPPSRLRTAAFWLTYQVPPSQVIHVLRLTDNPPPAFFVPFASGLRQRLDLAKLLPELERLALRKHSARSAVLEMLVATASEEKIEELWRRFLKDEDPARRQEAARALEHVLPRHLEVGEKIAAAFWADPDAGTRWATFQGIASCIDPRHRSPEPSGYFKQKMLALLDDSDPVRRRGASAALAQLLSVSTTATPSLSPAAPGPPTEPEAGAELAEREAIRQAARKHLGLNP